MMPSAFVPLGPSVLVYFTDGSRASLVDGLGGRKLDQILRVELHPGGGDILNGARDDGVAVVAMTWKLHELPFDVMTVLPKPDAAAFADSLRQVATGMTIARTMPS